MKHRKISRIIFHTRAWCSELCVALGRKLQQELLCDEVIHCTMFKDSHEDVLAAGAQSVYLPELMQKVVITEELTKEVTSFDREMIESFGFGINFLLSQERFVPKGVNEQDFVYRHYKVLSDLLIEDSVCISFTQEHFIYLLSAYISEIRNAFSFSFFVGGVPQDKTMVLRTPYDLWHWKGNPLIEKSQEIFEVSSAKLDLPVEKRLAYMAPIIRPSFIKRMKHIYRSRKFEEVDKHFGSYFYSKNTWKDRFPFNRLFSLRIFQSKEKFTPKIITVEDLRGVKYCFIPLHLEPEVTVLTLSPWINNQAELCRLVSLSLPLGWKLVVKENPKMLHDRKHSFYECIENLHNTYLCSTSISSIDLINHSQCVISLSGTACLEAMLKGKKAIYFGLPPFRLLISRSNIGNDLLFNQISKVLLEDYRGFMDKDLWKNYVASLVDTSIYPIWNDDMTYASKPTDSMIATCSSFICGVISEN